jgi:RHS repeat-associated protein
VAFPTGAAGVPYSAQISAFGAMPPLTLFGNPPDGLTYSTAGATITISGTPNGPFLGTFLLNVVDSNFQTGSAGFALNIGPSGSLVFTTQQVLPATTVGTPFSDAITATGGTPPYTVTSPGLPNWLAITNGPTGATLSGTAPIAGSGALTLTVTDARGNTRSQPFCITINPGPAISYQSPPYLVDTTTPIRLLPTLTGASAALYNLASGSTLPPGLVLDPTSGELSGTVTVPNTYSFIVQASTSVGTATATETLTVVEEPCDCFADSMSSPGSETNVNVATGELESAIVDLDLGGPLALIFVRYYSSGLATSQFSGALGTNWMHNFEVRLAVTSSAAMVTMPGGKQVRFMASGNAWTLAQPEQYIYQLVTTAGGYQFLDPSTKLITDFSLTGALVGIEDRNGNRLTITQGTQGPTGVSDGLGRSLSFSYNLIGQLTQVKDQSGRSISFGYTGVNLTSFIDGNGGTTSYSYTSGSLLASAVRPLGNTPATYAYNGAAQVQTETDSFGNTTSFAYDQNAGQTTITDARLNKQIDTNLNSYAPAKRTDALGQTTSFTYDSNFRPISFTDPLGSSTTATYLAEAGYQTSVVDAQGHSTTFTYTAQVQGSFTYYNLTTITLADGTSVGYTYDGRGNVLTATDQAGDSTTYTYNSAGQALTITNPAGGVRTNTFSSDGTLAKTIDPAGNTTTFQYDNLKRPIQATFADGSSAAVTYDLLDRVRTQTNENGNLTTEGYDANSNWNSLIDALSNTSTAVFDTNDRSHQLTDPRGQTTTYSYDPVGNMAAVIDATGAQTSFAYDAVNQLTSVKDPAGFGPSFIYDAAGHVIGVADALSNNSTFTRDQLGQIIQTTSPLGETSTTSYDSLGRALSTTDPRTQVTSYSYDPRGLLSQVAAPLGVIASFAHDQLGRLSGITDPNKNTWALQNDSSGRLISETDPLGRMITYGYDARNQVTTITSALGSAQKTYDAAGNLTQIQSTDGTAKSYLYDADDRMVSGNSLALGYDADGSIISSNGLAITRDAVSRIATITYAPAKTVTYTYNSRGLLAQVSDWTGGSMIFSYDNDARLISTTRSNGISTQYSYDKDSRTSSITERTSSQTLAAIALQRDADGNVISETRNVPQAPSPGFGVIGFTFDAAEQVSGYLYDSLGRLTKDGLQTYTWNLLSELTGYNGANGSATFAYDGLGMRTSVVSGGTTQNFVWNYALELPAVATVQSAGADQRYYIYSPSGALLYAIDASGNVHHWFHFDEVGSTTFLTDDAGRVTDSYGITPYGETVTATGSTPNPFTWLGEWGIMREGSTGLYYMRMREYDSTSARFLSRDPESFKDPRAVNPYQYSLGNPTGWTDPWGAQGIGIDALESWLPHIPEPVTLLGPVDIGYVIGTYVVVPIAAHIIDPDAGNRAAADLAVEREGLGRQLVEVRQNAARDVWEINYEKVFHHAPTDVERRIYQQARRDGYDEWTAVNKASTGGGQAAVPCQPPKKQTIQMAVNPNRLQWATVRKAGSPSPRLRDASPPNAVPPSKSAQIVAVP